MRISDAKIAVVHEWLTTYAGAERVLEQMLSLYPKADLFSLVDFLPDAERAFLQGRRPTTSFIQKLPLARKHFRHYLPLMPLAIEQLDLSRYDVVISSNHAVAKGVLTGPDQLHISYVYTPIRYAWDLQHQYLREANVNRGLRALIVRAILHYIRRWDQEAAQHVDVLVGISRYIVRRIWKCYRRRAHLIYPPVDVENFSLQTAKENYYVAASRMVPYKRMDLIAEAFSRTPHRRLVMIGDGPEFKKVRAKAGSNVELLGYQPGNVLRMHLQNAKAFIFAAEEDFGIAPVEAQACGTPVIAYGKGGATETILEGETGLFFDEQTPASLLRAVDLFEQRAAGFDPYRIRARAEQFDTERFRRELSALVTRSWNRFERKKTFRSGIEKNRRLLNVEPY